MDITTPGSETMNSTSTPASARRAAVQRSTKTKRGLLFYLPFCGLLAAAMIVGVAVGALVVRQRHRAQAVVVSVNGAIITQENLFNRLQADAGNAEMRQIINEELLEQYARQEHLLPNEAQVEAAWQQFQHRSGPAAIAAARDPGEIKRKLRIQLIQSSLLSQNVTVTSEEAKAFYKAQTDKRNPNAQFYTPETATIAVILTPTEAEARAALHELSTGVAFATAANKYSKDTSCQNGGVLPPIQRGRASKQIPGLEAAIFGMKIGEQIGPQKFANVWWIIRCLDKTAEVTQPFDSVQEECRRGATLVKGFPKNKTSSEKGFAEFKQKANVQAFWPNYRGAAQLR